MSRGERWTAGVLARRRLVLGAGALCLAILAPGALRLATDNSPPVWFLAGAPEVERHRAFVDRFGSDEGFRIVLDGEEIWSRAGLARLERIEREVAALPGVLDVASLVRAHRPDFERFPPDDPAALREVAEASLLDRAMGWVSADGGAVSLLVATAPLSPRAVAGLAAEIERRVRPQPGEEASAPLRTAVLGQRSLELALDRSSLEIGRRYLPLLALVAIALLLAVVRDPAALAVPLGFVLFCEAITLGAMGWAGVRLNLVLAILPPLIFVIALATSIHVLLPVRARLAAGAAPAAAVVAVWRDKGRALFWTGLSTAVGFAALAVSPVPPVRALGLWAGVGLGAQTLAAFTLLPALLAGGIGGAARRRPLEVRLERAGRRVAAFATRHRSAILAVWLAAAGVAALGLGRLAPESDALRYLAPDHPVRAEWERVEALGLGLATVELELAAPPGGEGWRSAAGLAALERLTAALRAARIPGLLGAAGAGDLAAEIGQRSPLAVLATREETLGLGLTLLTADDDGERALARFVTADGRRARVTIFVRSGGFEAIDPLAAQARQVALDELPPASDVVATGTLLLLLGFHRHLLATLALSLTLTLPVLAGVFARLLRRPTDVLRALVPNVVPIVLLLGGMGWVGIGLDVATVMVASIVLGLVVDDTIHSLARHRERRGEVGGAAAIAERLERTAPAYLLTGAILAAGFGVCALSDFAPIARFGSLSAATVVIAVLADLTLVPALFGRD